MSGIQLNSIICPSKLCYVINVAKGWQIFVIHTWEFDLKPVPSVNTLSVVCGVYTCARIPFPSAPTGHANSALLVTNSTVTRTRNRAVIHVHSLLATHCAATVLITQCPQTSLAAVPYTLWAVQTRVTFSTHSCGSVTPLTASRTRVFTVGPPSPLQAISDASNTICIHI